MNNHGPLLCIFSLGFMFLMPAFNFMFGSVFMNGDISGSTARGFGVMIGLEIISYITAWALAIIARVRYRSTFSLVVLIIYGVMTVLSIVAVIALFGMFAGLF